MPFILSKTFVFACKEISVKTNYVIEAVKPEFKLSVLPTIKIRFEKLSIKTKSQGLFVDIDNFKTCVRLLPLLSGRLHINNLYVDKLSASARIDEHFYFERDIISEFEKKVIKCDELKLNDFEIKLEKSNSKTPLIYKGNRLEFSETHKYLNFVLDSKIHFSNRISDIKFDLFLPKNNDINTTKFDINISNIEMSEYGKYFKDFLPEDLVSLNGVINVKANNKALVATLKKCAINMKDASKSLIFPDVLNIVSDFSINKKFIKINKTDIFSKTINVSMSGKISNYMNKNAGLDCNVIINKSRFEDITKLLPPIVIEEFNVYKLKKYPFYADAVGHLNIKGKFPEPDIFGDVLITNGILVKPLKDTPKGATVKLNFSGRYINYDVTVPAKKTEKVMVKGTAELYNIRYAKTKVTSTQNVDLELTETVLLPLHQILNFELGPLPIMDVHGIGNIDIDIKGIHREPHIWGAFNFRNSTIKFNDMPDIVMENASGIMPFNDTDIEFITKTGKVNGKDFSVKGKCNISGKFDFNVATKEQPLNKMYHAMQTATIYPEMKELLPKFDFVSGTMDMDLKIFGNMKYIEDMEFGKNLFVKALVNLKNGKFRTSGIEICNTNGKIELDEKNNLQTDIKAFIDKYPMTVKVKTKNEIADVLLNIPKLNPNFLVRDKVLQKAQLIPEISLNAKYRGHIKKFETEKLVADIKVLKPVTESNVKINTGTITVKNGDIVANNLCANINNSQNQIKANLKIKNAFNKKPNFNGNVYVKVPDLKLINEIFAYEFLPKTIKNYLKNFEFNKGSINTDFKVVNNKIFANVDLSGFDANYIPLELPLNLVNGNLVFKNNAVYLQKINMLADKMPILIDGNISDIFDKQKFNIYINSKPQQEFIDKYINTKQIYPVKIKGDIVSTAYIKGTQNNFDVNCDINLNKEASFYYYGATIGDIENAISLSLLAQILNQNEARIKEFSYDKLIESQRGKQTVMNLLKAWGTVQTKKDDILFRDFHIKTSNPTDARIFNIIFRKPDIKQGQFTSDLKINGNLQNPKIVGDFNITEAAIPFFDIIVKNISLDFCDKTINISSKGDVMNNDVIFQGVLSNNLTPPYYLKDGTVYLKNLNLNNVIKKIKNVQADESISHKKSIEDIGINSLIYDNILIKADNIELRNIKATDVEAHAKMSKDGIFEIPSFKFNIANGSIIGQYSLNMNNDNLSFSMKAEDIDANDITQAVFDIDNQIYGSLTGGIDIACDGKNYKNCLKTLEGDAIFNVKNGRMPKLGSLEYLLKAGNLVKGGITGISINGIIDIITPLKTGEFSDIYGSIEMNDGIANKIEITTQGKDLSLFIAGNYNLSTSNATMEVFGILSRKISTMFGVVGNLSMNTLFNVIPGVDLSQNGDILSKINKIPGIELSNKAIRKFVAEINGNIDGDNYVSSFMWIN